MMMKRTGVPRLGPDEPAPHTNQAPAQIQQAGASTMHAMPQSAQPQILAGLPSAGGGMVGVSAVGGGNCATFGRTAPRAASPAVINYLKAGVQYAAPKPPQVPPRIKPSLPQMPSLPLGRQSPGATPPAPPGPPGAAGAPQFQRLKVEDALSYLDQVKYKFNTQPQVYNDFLDIMKEFKSQTIDTPGVITRVSNLFQGHPELIVGFNTFLPPGYKIEVQSNGQVSVSMPSPTGLGAGAGAAGVLLGVHHTQPQPQLVHLLPVAQPVTSAIVHNLSVNAPPSNTLHHISQAHQQIEASAIHHTAGTVQPPQGSGPHPSAAPPGQPVEFNHAIEYVNKIKSRFSKQPDKYKRFLEILHAYQRGHRDLKEPQAKQQTEQEVYSQVAKLFENQEDLLAEFGQFLPDAKAVTKPSVGNAGSVGQPHYAPRTHSHSHSLSHSPPATHHHAPHHATHHQASRERERDRERERERERAESESERFVSTPSSPPPHHQHHAQVPKHTNAVSSTAPPAPQHHHLKRSPSFTSATQIGAPLAKRPRASCPPGAAPAAPPAGPAPGGALRDVSYAEAAKLATLHDYNFFDKARKALRSQTVYDNFLRCLLLFTNEIISSSELLCVTAPFFCRHPDLHKWLQDFIGPQSPPHTPTATHTGYGASLLGPPGAFERDKPRYEPIGALAAQLRHDRAQGDAAMDIDLSTCKRLGTSYCALPRDAAARKCSGRTALCREVLNDTWVSFPTWSEDSTFVTSRKTQYEEYIYRCEDERFELDVVIETNAATIRVLEGVQKKLSRLSAEEAGKQRLDECLGGHSPTIHQRALRRIYGDKVAVDIIAGLKKNPVVAVPVVLRRLKAKEEEWREAQKGFNKQWREQNEKYYLKSLDHQGISFKQNDLKAMRSKALFNEVESAYAARRRAPHLAVDYELRTRHEAIKILRDASELLIHHARRQTGIQKAEKRRIKQLLRHFLPDLFSHPRQPLSDDERDDDKQDPRSPDSPSTEVPEDKANSIKQEKHQESSESDNASDKSGRNNKNDKENKPKNNNNTDAKETGHLLSNSVKRSSSNEDAIKSDMENDLRDRPPNEARFVCSMSWYLFLRLHGTLCSRLGAARRTAMALHEQDARDRTARRPSVAHALRLKPNNLPADASCPAEYYNALLELVRGVLDGNMESSAYEDAAREMLGIKAYPAYTLDKVVSIAVRQLQHCVSEPWSVRATELAQLAQRPSARPHSAAPLRRAARALRQHTAFLVRVYGGDECRVTYELLEGAAEGRTSPQHDASRLSPTTQPRGTNGESASLVAAWSLYAERYARPDVSVAPLPRNKPVFLLRNVRRNGAYATCNTAAGPSGGGAGGGEGGSARRRKPPTHRVHDLAECTLTPALRLVASRPQQLYRCGALWAAQASHARLHAARTARFRAWLRTRTSL